MKHSFSEIRKAVVVLVMGVVALVLAELGIELPVEMSGALEIIVTTVVGAGLVYLIPNAKPKSN